MMSMISADFQINRERGSEEWVVESVSRFGSPQSSRVSEIDLKVGGRGAGEGEGLIG
jgi:hypothetical protein